MLNKQRNSKKRKRRKQNLKKVQTKKNSNKNKEAPKKFSQLWLRLLATRISLKHKQQSSNQRLKSTYQLSIKTKI